MWVIKLAIPIYLFKYPIEVEYSGYYPIPYKSLSVLLSLTSMAQGKWTYSLETFVWYPVTLPVNALFGGNFINVFFT